MTDVLTEIRSYVPILISVLLSTVAQIMMKIGMLDLADIDLEPLSTMEIFTHQSVLHVLAWVMFGIACYTVSMIVWIGALSRVELSVAYPMLSLSYPLVYVFATHSSRLAEIPTTMRTGGIVLILLGVLLIMSTSDSADHASST